MSSAGAAPSVPLPTFGLLSMIRLAHSREDESVSPNANGEFVLRHVHVHVPDVASLAEWYKSHFGLEEIYKFEDKLTILGSAGDCQIGFEAGEAVSHPERIHLIFRVPDVDEWHGKVSGATGLQTSLRSPATATGLPLPIFSEYRVK